MTDTTAHHIAARDDMDLVARLTAAAEQAHIPQPAAFVQANLGKIISTPVNGTGTITTSHAYANRIRAEALAALPPKPGIDPGAILDEHLSAAILAVWAPPEVP